MEIKDLICEIREYISRENELQIELNDCDKKVSDFLHYIEFNKLDIQRGYKIYKELYEVLNRRRDIKNQIAIIQSLKSHGYTITQSNKILKVIKQHEKLHYNPRIMPELFTPEQKGEYQNA